MVGQPNTVSVVTINENSQPYSNCQISAKSSVQSDTVSMDDSINGMPQSNGKVVKGAGLLYTGNADAKIIISQPGVLFLQWDGCTSNIVCEDTNILEMSQPDHDFLCGVGVSV